MLMMRALLVFVVCALVSADEGKDLLQQPYLVLAANNLHKYVDLDAKHVGGNPPGTTKYIQSNTKYVPGHSQTKRPYRYGTGYQYHFGNQHRPQRPIYVQSGHQPNHLHGSSIPFHFSHPSTGFHQGHVGRPVIVPYPSHGNLHSGYYNPAVDAGAHLGGQIGSLVGTLISGRPGGYGRPNFVGGYRPRPGFRPYVL